MIKFRKGVRRHKNLEGNEDIMSSSEETLTDNGNLDKEQCVDCNAQDKQRQSSDITVKVSSPTRHSDDTKSLTSLTVNLPTEGSLLKRSESEIGFMLPRSPKKFRKAIASLSPKIGSKRKRRVTVNEYPQFFPFSHTKTPANSHNVEPDFPGDTLAVSRPSEAELKTRSLDNRHRHAKLQPSSSMPPQSTKAEKKRMRSTSLLNKPCGGFSIVEFDGHYAEEDHVAKGRSLPQIFRYLAPNSQRKKSFGLFKTEEDLPNKTCADPTSTLSGLNPMKVSGLSIPDDSAQHHVVTNVDDNDNSHNRSCSPGSDSKNLPSTESEQRSSVEAIKQKMIKATEMITKERSLRDENIAEYTKLIANADRQQIIRIKSVFEAKNQKISLNIDKLQKKMDGYQKKIKELETAYDRSMSVITKLQNARNGSGRQSPVAQNGAETLNGQTTLNGVPRVNTVGKTQVDSRTSNNLTASTLHESSSYNGLSQLFATSTGSDLKSLETIIKSANGSGKANPAQQLHALSNYLDTLRSELQTIRGSQLDLKNYYVTQVEEMERAVFRQLDEDSVRRELQLNEVTEAQQREVTLLKQELLSIEEKMEYHAHEQARDTQELLERCQNRIAKVDIQLHQTETNESASARALLGKLINLLVTVLALVLVLLSTVTGFVRPFMQTRVHLLLSIFAIVVAFLIYNNWNIVKPTAKWYQLNHHR